MVNVFTIGNGNAGNTKAKVIVGLIDKAEAHGIAKGIPALGNGRERRDGTGQLPNVLGTGFLGQAAQSKAVTCNISGKIKLHFVMEF